MVTATTPASCSLSTVGGVVNSHNNTVPSYVGQDQVISLPLSQPAVTLASRMVITILLSTSYSKLVDLGTLILPGFGVYVVGLSSLDWNVLACLT
jgi:hypothetical protein